VPGIVPPTTLVKTVNVADVPPAGTVTVAGTLSGSMADKLMIAPPASAGAVNTAVPVSDPPPTMVDALKVMLDRAMRATVSVGDCPAAPPAVAEMVAVPAATPVTTNVAVAAPAGTVMLGATVATDALLLVSVTVTAAAGAAASVTVPCVVPPTPIADAASATLATVLTLVLGAAGDDDPQPIAAIAAIRTDEMENMCRGLLIRG